MMRVLHTLSAMTASALFFGCVVATPLRAQAWEWEPDEGYHQEEWYDPSDWFDADSGIDYEYDWDDYYWNDYYDWGYYYPYDYDPYGRHDHYWDPYYWDTYRGYRGPYYDYRLHDEDWVWSSSKNRWVHSEEFTQSAGENGDDRERSGESKGESKGESQSERRGSQTPYPTMLRGTLENYSTVNLRGQRDKHLVVRLKLRDGTKRLVNLGPNANIGDFGLEQGKEVVVHGRKGHIGGRAVLMATRIRAAGETTRIRGAQVDNQRDSQRDNQRDTQRDNQRNDEGMTSLRGRIDNWTKMQLGTGDRREHLFVRLALENGRTAIVNFGPNAELSDLELEYGDRVVIRGRERKANGRDVLFARDVRIESEPIQLDWKPASRNRSSNESRTGTQRRSRMR